MTGRVSNAWKSVLSCAALLLATSSYGAPTAPPLAACPAGFQPIPPLPVPKLPVGESLAFVGTVQVRFVIDQTGRVHSPIVVSDTLQPVGRHRGERKDYHHMMVATVAQFRYPAQATPCSMDVPFEIGFDDEVDEAARAVSQDNA